MKIILFILTMFSIVSNLNGLPAENEKSENLNKKSAFKGHWGFFELGFNSFKNVSYSGYAIKNFMDLNQSKSLETNINLFRFSTALQKHSKNLGLLTGLGLNFNDYRFTKPYTIVQEGGTVQPVLLEENTLSKSKLSTCFVMIPLIFEFHETQRKNVYFSLGIIGGMKLASHTKVIANNSKDKTRDDFCINPFRYGATARMGIKQAYLFGTWYFTPFFTEGRGPEMFPLTLGIGINRK